MKKFACCLLSITVVSAFVVDGCQSLPVPNGTTRMPVVTTTASFTPTAAFTPTGTHTPFPTSTPTTTPYPQPEAVFSPENADQIRQLTRLGKGKVNALSYSPDGNYLAVGTSIGVVLYDTHTWSETLIDIEDRVDTLEFAPKGDILAVGLNNGTVQLLQVPDGTLARTFVYNTVAPLNVEKIYDRGNYQGIRYQRNAGETERVLAFSSDGEYLAAGGWDGTVRLWQVADGTLLKTIHGEFMINDIAFHPGERSVAIVDGSDVTEWQFADGGDTEPLQADLTYNTWESSYDWFDRIAFSSNGKSLTGWSGEEVVHWRTSDAKKAGSSTVSAWDRLQDLTPDGKTIAIVINDLWLRNALEVWDLESNRRLQLDVEHPEWIRHIAITPDGTALAVSFQDGEIQILDVTRNETLQVLGGFPDSVDDIQMPSNSSELLSFTRLFDQHLLQVWNLPEAANKETIDLSRYGAKNDSRIVFSPDGSLLAVASKNLLLWDFRNRKLIKSLQGDEEMFYSNISDVAFSADDNSIAYSFDYGGLRLATTTGDVILSLDEASGRAGLCLFEDGQILTNGSQFWDLERSRLINTANSFHAERLFFTQGCDMFASMTEEGYFRVKRNNRGEILGERVGDFDLRTEGIYLIAPAAFSPDRKLVAVQEAVGRIRIFNLQTMETLTVLEGHRDTITGLLFTPDGNKLISSSLDGTIRLWGIHP